PTRRSSDLLARSRDDYLVAGRHRASMIRRRTDVRPGALRLDRGVYLVDQLLAVSQLEVLREVAVGARSGLAVERHVQRHQPRAVEVAALASTSPALAAAFVAARAPR